MTLYKQLLTSLLAIMFILAVSVFYTQYRSVYDYLEEQQEISINNLSRTLELGIEPYIKDNEVDAIDPMVKSLYHHGFYGYIRLHLYTSEETFHWGPSSRIASIPNWFVELVSIKPVIFNRDVQVDGKLVGQLDVTGSTDLSYLKLWQATIDLVTHIIIALILGAIFIAFILKRILVPLKKMQYKTTELSHQHFGDALELPRTLELKKLAIAINSMSDSLKVKFNTQEAETEKLRQRAYQDLATGLGNIEYLTAKYSHLEPGIDSMQGGLILLKSELIELYHQRGEQDIVIALSKRLGHQLTKLADPHKILATISESEFVLACLHSSPQQLQTLAEEMQQLAATIDPEMPLSIKTTSLAGIVIGRQHDVHHQLNQARIAIQEARLNGTINLSIYRQELNQDLHIRTKPEWQKFVKEAVMRREIKLSTQNVLDRNNQIMHQEIFAYYVENDDQSFTAQQFVPSVEFESEGLLLDMYVLDMAFTQLSSHPTLKNIAVNITPNSIKNDNFLRWLTNKLQNYAHLSSQLFFELPEKAFLLYKEQASVFCQVLQDHKFQYGIDQFAQDFNDTDYLIEFDPAYVKLAPSYSSTLDDDSKDVLDAILRIMHQRHIQAIATRVETSQQFEHLTSFQLDGYQGFLTDSLLNQDQYQDQKTLVTDEAISDNV